jgi:polyisoprenoid-binding protein YceI
MTSADTGDSGRDESLPTGDWFATQRFPRATFVTRAITRTGAQPLFGGGET